MESSTDPVSRVRSSFARSAAATVAMLALVKLGAHLATNVFGPYGFHRDEFLYFAMGRHLQLFSMDFPPMIAILSQLVRGTLGDSIVAIRLPVALASTSLVVLAALSARLLDGRWFAQGLAAFSVIASVLFWRSGNLFQPVALDQLFWSAALLALLMLGKTENPRWWIAYGLTMGLGLLAKFSILFLGAATLCGLLVTRERRWFLTPWPWLAAVIAILIGSPSIIGQIRLGFPVVGQMADLTSNQLERITYAGFISDQFILHGGALVAFIGMFWLVLSRRTKSQRLLGVTSLAAFVILMLLRGKSYYIGPIFPVLFGAGAVVLESVSSRIWGPIARWGAVLFMAVYLGFLLPLGLPILGPQQMESYLVAMGMQEAAITNVGAQERIPQDFADMLNWEEMTEAVARVYRDLPEEDRRQAVILPSNYGEAGAIEFYGPRYGLPEPVCYVGSYWYYGPGELPGNVLILVGHDAEDWVDVVQSLRQVAEIGHPYAVAEERPVTIAVARGPFQSLQDIWPSLEGIH